MWAALAALLAAPAIYLAVAVASGDGSASAVFGRGATWIAVLRTLALGLTTAALCLLIAVPLAWLTHATDLPARRVFAVLLNLPLAVPSYVGAFVVVALFAPGGSLSGFWRWLGFGDVYGGAGATLAILFSYPLALLPLQAALSRVDPRLFESARSLGASPARAFFSVVMPQLRPAMGTGAILVALYAVGDFGAVSLLRFKSLSYLIYVRYKSLFDRDEAAVLGLLLVAVATALVLALLWAKGRVGQQLSWAGERRRWPVVALGRWRWFAFALCAAVVTAGLGLPLYVVGSWIARGLSLGHSISIPWTAIGHSLELAASAAALLCAAALVPALIARYSGVRGGRWLGAITHIGYALPGIVVALALVSLAAQHMRPLYQTLTLLIAAYALRFFPLALHSTDDGIAGHNRGLFWAARSLGAGPVAACWRVIIPNARPAVAAAFLASFVAVLKELPLTLLLSPPGYETLATRIWMLTEDAYFFEVAPAVLALLAIAAAAMLFAPRRSSQ